MRNLPLEPLRNPSAFRQISLGSWRDAKDPTVYGSITLRMDEALRYRDEFRSRTGRRLTVTHMMARAIGAVLEEVPDVNAIMRWGRIYLRKDNVVFFQVAMKDPDTGRVDLSAHTVHQANERDLLDILDDFERSVARVRAASKSQSLERTRRMLKVMPAYFAGLMTEIISFFAYTLNLDLSGLGLPSKTFGPVAVTNVGAMGIEEAYVPLVPYSRAPTFVALGAVRKTPIVDEDDSIVVAQTMKVMATFDHRILDGAHAAKMCGVLTRWFEDPYAHFGPIPEAGPTTEAGESGHPGEPPIAEAVGG